MPGDKPEIEEIVRKFVTDAMGQWPALEMKIEDEAPEGEIAIFVGHFDSHIYVDEHTSEIKTELKEDVGIVQKLREALGQKPTLVISYPNMNGTAAPETRRAIVPMKDKTVRDLQIADLTIETIKAYICPKATDAEAGLFLMQCQARGLNPFIGEVHLVKYSESDPAKTVVGKDAFTKRASEDPAFEYYRAGIIVQKGDQIEEREGTFYAKGEDLIGGWAEVYLKDREKPFKYSIRREGFDKKKAVWNQIPEVMCRKCALVGALREALPEKLGGLYDAAEMKDVVDVEYMVEA
ncbi:MAG: phage recombination protein Bet [Synergistaceae bacterium]|jgi:phage recombination protein Bet